MHYYNAIVLNKVQKCCVSDSASNTSFWFKKQSKTHKRKLLELIQISTLLMVEFFD